MKEFLKKIPSHIWTLILFIFISVFFFAFDIISKQIVLHNMNVGETINIIPNFFYFQYVINDGMAFGLNFNITSVNSDAWKIANKIIFISVSVIGTAIISFIFFRKYKTHKKLVTAALALMLAGCVGNLIDRIFYTQEYLSKYATGVETYGVVDFIAFDFGSYSFPRFNIADSCLVIGVIILIAYLIVEEIKEAKERRLREESELPEGKILSKDEAEMMKEEPKKEVENKEENNEL